MAYADTNEMSKSRLISIILVAGLHVFLGYALVTGLAHEAVEKAISTITAVEVEEEDVPEEEPPPPEPELEIVPPPVFVPPPPITPPAKKPQVTTVNKEPPPPPITKKAEVVPQRKSCGGGISVLASEACPPQTKQCPDGSTINVSATCPAPKVSSRPKPEPRNNVGRWATSNDYPPRALREEREGSAKFTVQVNAKGRVSSCSVTRSSGHADLDKATCKNVSRRARFRPALTPDGAPTTGSYSNTIRWAVSYTHLTLPTICSV